MSRKTYPYPVPIVRMIVEDARGRVLILRRSADNSHAPHGWSLPGGKIDYGDSVEEACRRELKEETGLECIECTFLFYQDSLPQRDEAMHCINLYLKCTVQGELSINAESSEFAWIGPDNLAHYDLVFRNDTGLRRYWFEK